MRVLHTPFVEAPFSDDAARKAIGKLLILECQNIHRENTGIANRSMRTILTIGRK